MIDINNSEHWIIQQSVRRPEATAIISGDELISIGRLSDLCCNYAGYLKSIGIKENENVGVLFNHSYEFFIVINALWILGAVPVLINTKNIFEETASQLKFAEVKILIIDKTFLQKEMTENSLLECLSKIKIEILEFDKNQTIKTNLEFQHSAFCTLHPSLILFTSGSSGKPKAVVHTFKSLYESVAATDLFSGLSTKDIWLASLPLYHIGGFMILIRSLISGAACVFPPSLKHVDVEKAITKYLPSHISIVSTTLKKFLENNFRPQECLENVFLGGGPIDTELSIDALRKGWPLVKVYGSSETCSMAAALNTEEYLLKPDSVGKAIGQNKIFINSVNTGSKEVAGEIIVKCNSIFKEYLNNRELTNNKLIDGVYYTGDFGWIDDEGYLFVESRREDIIITGGENVTVSEIELLLKTNESVKDVVVFGVPDKAWGQKICAAIVAKDLDEDKLKFFLKNKTASYKIPKAFYFTNEIPKTEMGKVNRALLFKQLNLG